MAGFHPNSGTSPNYTPTDDPKVVTGKYGVPITYDQFLNANQNGFAWKDFHSFADYVGGWAHPVKDPVSISPYYRHYGNGQNINGGDIALIQAKYQNDPQVQAIIKRSSSTPGEVPQFGADDGDVIKSLIAKEKVTAKDSGNPDSGLYNAIVAVKGK